MKRFLVLMLAALTVAVLLPQHLAAGVGVKGGFNFTNVSFNPAIPELPNSAMKNLRGVTGGVFFSLNLGLIGFQPELLYSRRGAMWELDDEILGPVKAESLTDYIEVPLLIKFSVLPAGPIRPTIFGGPSYGYLLKATRRVTIGGITDSEDVKDELEKSAVAAIIGAGLELKTPIVLLTLDARYHWGFTDIAKDPDQTVKHRGFTVMVGVGF